MERPLGLPREVKCGIRGLERRIRKCREFYLGELVRIVEGGGAAPAAMEKGGEKEPRWRREEKTYKWAAKEERSWCCEVMK